MANNKTDQGSMFKLPKGTAHTEYVNGGTVVSDYGSRPTQDTYNPDRGQRWPRDPQRGRDASGSSSGGTAKK